MPRIRTQQASPPAANAEFVHTLQHARTRLSRETQIKNNARHHGCPYATSPAFSPLREAHATLTEQLRRRRQFFQQAQAQSSERIDPALLRGAPTVWCACDDHDAGGSARKNSDQARAKNPDDKTRSADSQSQKAAQTGSRDEPNGLLSAPGHTHGFLAVDLDEAVHGVYAATKQGLNASAANGKNSDASFLKEQAIDILPSGPADTALGLTAGALMLPLAALAIKGGVRECRQSKTMTARLRTEKQRYRQQQADMKLLFTRPDTPSASASPLAPSTDHALTLAQHADTVRIKGLQHGTRSEENTWAIGVSSAASGSTIGTKAAADIGMSTGFGIEAAINGQGFAQAASAVSSGAGVGAAGVFALASTWVIAPLAGLFATSLGAFMLHKTRTHRARLKTAFAAASTDLQGSVSRLKRNNIQCTRFVAYASFIETQGKTRLDFLRKFKHWNTAFVTGSGLYAASAIAKAVLIGLGAAGIAAAASNPVGAGILLGVGLAGAVAMAIGSIAFFTGHDKQNRYARSAYLDHQLVDRHLIALDMMNCSSSGTDSALEQALAPKLLEHIEQRDTGIKTLLDACANATGKTAKHSAQHSIWKRLQGKSLKASDIETWLKTDAGATALREMIKADLQSHGRYLRNRLQARLNYTEAYLAELQTTLPQSVVQQGSAQQSVTAQALTDAPFAPMPTSPTSRQHGSDGQTAPLAETQTAPPSSEAELLEAMTRFFGAHDAKLEQDQMELETTRQLLRQLDSEPAPALDDALCSLLGEHYLPGHGIASIKSLAAHLNGEVSEDLQAARDCLFDAQLDSTRIQKSFALGQQNEANAPSTA